MKGREYDPEFILVISPPKRSASLSGTGPELPFVLLIYKVGFDGEKGQGGGKCDSFI